MTNDQIKHMIDRFLGWRLPDNFNPDGGISFKKAINADRPSWPQNNEPVGTNLLDATQAEEMVRYMVEGIPAAESAAIPPAPPKSDRPICKHCGLRLYLDKTTVLPVGTHWRHHGSNLRECYITFAEPLVQDHGPRVDTRTREEIARDYYLASGRANSEPTKEALARIDAAASQEAGSAAPREETVKKGTMVRYWTGVKEGKGRVGKVSYDGVYDICGSDCIYVAGVGAVAVTHVEEIQDESFPCRYPE